MNPRFLIVFTMSLCGLFAGLAGTTEILGDSRATCPPRTRPRSASTPSPSRSWDGRTRSGSSSPASCSAPCRPGPARCRSRRGIPVQFVSILQAIILFFLTAEILVRRIFRVRKAAEALGDVSGIAGSYGQRVLGRHGRAVQHPGHRPDPRVHRLRRGPRASHRAHRGRGRRAGRPWCAVRVHERAVRRGEHRDRGHDADRRLRGVVGRVPRLRCHPCVVELAALRHHRAAAGRPGCRASWPPAPYRRCTPGCRSPSGPTRSSAARSSTSSPSASPAT